MQKIVDRIKAQQEKMGYIDFFNQSPDGRIAYIREVTLALVKEAMEFLDETPWKPWGKKADRAEYNLEAAALEICDIIVFAIVLYLSLHPTIPLEEAMERTLAKIDERLKQGYSKKEK